jgi:hypothetical protein
LVTILSHNLLGILTRLLLRNYVLRNAKITFLNALLLRNMPPLGLLFLLFPLIPILKVRVRARVVRVAAVKVEVGALELPSEGTSLPPHNHFM